MRIDPEEMKIRRIKRKDQIFEIQRYFEEQDALTKEQWKGKMGHHEVRVGEENKKYRSIVKRWREGWGR